MGLSADPEFVEAVDRSADPESARAVLARLATADPDSVARLVEPRRRDALIALACASRSLSASVVADPSLLDVVDDPGFEIARDSAAVREELTARRPFAGPSGAISCGSCCVTSSAWRTS
jgi:hypothetical protein